jgi:hypothetical protein
MNAPHHLLPSLRGLLFGGVTADADLERLRKIVVLHVTTLMGGTFIAVFALLNFLSGHPILAVADVIAFGFISSAFLVSRLRGNLRLASWLTVLPTTAFFLFVLATADAGLSTYLWSLTIPLVTVFLLDLRTGLTLAAFYLAAMVGLFVAADHVDGLTRYPAFVQTRALVVYILVGFAAAVMDLRRRKVHEALRRQRARLADQIDSLERGRREKETLIGDLQRSLAEVRTLKSFLPICSYCKKIRDDDGYWSELEQYLAAHTDARVEMNLCPECQRKDTP